MSIFSRLVWGDSPEVRAISASSFDIDLPVSASGDPFRGLSATDRALRLAYSYACVRIISDWLAAAPLQFRSRRTGQRVDPPAWYADPYPVWDLTPTDWMFQAASSVVMNGNAYGIVRATDQIGLPAMVRWLSPVGIRMTVANGTDEINYFTVDGRQLDRARVLHARGVTLSGSPTGISPVDQFRHVIDLGLSAEDFTAAWFRGGTHPTSMLSAKNALTADEAKRIKDRWIAATSGERGVVVAGNDMAHKVIQSSPAESNAIEVAWQAGREASTVWGVPPWMLNVPSESGMTYANVDQIWSQFQTGTLRFLANRLEKFFNHPGRWLPPETYCRFNLDAGVRSDLSTRMAAYAIQIDKRIRSVNEVRELEDLPPAPWGETPALAESVTDAVQKVYLGVGKVLTSDEARKIVNAAGADLPIPGGVVPVPVKE